MPVGDFEALATAIEATLEVPPQRDRLVERAQSYSLESSVAGYEAALTAIAQAGRPQRQDRYPGAESLSCGRWP